jgi:hypothetical protein
MTIPYSDSSDDLSRTAGYLKFVFYPDKNIWFSALFIMNARGEPVEFTHARVRSPQALLWRPDDLRTRCQSSLCASMFDLCPVTPDIILCLDAEVSPDLFMRYLNVKIPVGFVAPDGSIGEWSMEISSDSIASRLSKRLSKRELLLEPFERALVGLGEVYSDLLA